MIYFKAVLVGDSGVSKTSLLRALARHASDALQHERALTFQSALEIKLHPQSRQHPLYMLVWDTCGKLIIRIKRILMVSY